jgi:hypothetical protein
VFVTREGYAAWLINPEDYDENAADGAMGGQLFESLAKPVNCAADTKGRVIVGQDANAYVMSIDTSVSPATAKQIALEASKTPTAGPGVVAAPDGSVWVACIMASGYINRFRPGSDVPESHQLGRSHFMAEAAEDVLLSKSLLSSNERFELSTSGKQALLQTLEGRRVIHFAFGSNKMYALTTMLGAMLGAPEAIIEVPMTAEGDIDGTGEENTWFLGLNGNTHRIIAIDD